MANANVLRIKDDKISEIERIIKDRGLRTRDEVAAFLGVSRPVASRFGTGHYDQSRGGNARFSVETMSALADVLLEDQPDWTLDDILERPRRKRGDADIPKAA